MGLPHLFPGAKKLPQQRLFLALDLGEDAVTAGLWNIEENVVKFVKASSPIEWKGTVPSDAAEAADVALGELGQEADNVGETVFGFPESWVVKQFITPEKKPFIKELKEKLQLKPLGFVVTTEALVHYLQGEEGGPISAVLLQYTAASITVSVVKAGKILGTEVVGRSGDSVADVSEGLARFSHTSFPARMIVCSARMRTEELEQEKQTLLSNEWQKTSKFLHIPRIDTLPPQSLIRAVCLAGGTEVAVSLGYISRGTTTSAQNVSLGEIAADTSNRAVVVETVEDEPERSEAPVDHPSPAVAETLTEEFGFHEVAPEGHAEEPHLETEYVEPAMPVENNTQPLPPAQPKQPFFAGLRNIKLTLPTFTFPRIQFPSLSFSGKGKMVLGVAAGVLLAGIVGGMIVLAVSARALVTVTLKTLPLAKDVDVVLDPTAAQTNATTSTIKAAVVTKEVSGTKEVATTGTKTIGDKAKGKVTIFNATSSEKTFASGTMIASDDRLRFVLDTEVIVPPASGSSALTSQLGKADVAVTAMAIGANANLPAKTEFSVANFDKKTYVATNDIIFSGGSSREIQAVAKSDLSSLETALTEELKKKAEEALKQDEVGDTHIVSANEYDVTSSEFSAKAGEEARLVSLSMKLTAKGLAYTTADILPVAQSQLSDTLPSGAVLRQEKTQMTVQSLERKEGMYNLRVSLVSEAIPSFDKSAAVSLIKGKTSQQAVNLLKDIKDVFSADVRFSPALAKYFPGTIPGDAARMTIQTTL